MRKNLTLTEFVNRSNIIHNYKYDYSKSIYIDIKTGLIIICPIHGEFLQKPNGHIVGQGCPQCKGDVIGNLFRSNIDDFIIKAKKIHGDKYDYSKSLYNGSLKKMIIICPTHGEFLQKPNNHLTGSGCLYCVKNFRLTTDTFIEKVIKIHGNKYDYSKSMYKNNRSKIEIICPLHGSFFPRAAQHLVGGGCRKCWIEKCGINLRSNSKEFINRSTIVHNKKYDYSGTNYITNNKKVIIICPTHGKFLQNPGQHLLGVGCPMCNSSKGELKISNYLKNKYINYVSNKTFGDCKNPKTNWRLKFDFYIPSKNLLIEYDGAQHYTVVTSRTYKMTQKDLDGIQYRDNLKTEYAKKNGIHLLRIGYKDFSRIETILTDTLDKLK